MDKIFMRGLEFYGYHGCLPSEKVNGQRFLVDIELYIDTAPAGKQDDLEKTIDYGKVYQDVKAVLELERYDLIEAVAENVAARILANYPVGKVRVAILKPHAPIEGKFDTFGVEIERGKD